MPDSEPPGLPAPRGSDKKLERTGSVRTMLQVYLPNGEVRGVKYGESSTLKVSVTVLIPLVNPLVIIYFNSYCCFLFKRTVNNRLAQRH